MCKHPAGIQLDSVGDPWCVVTAYGCTHDSVVHAAIDTLRFCCSLQHDATLHGVVTHHMCAGAVAKGPKLDDIQPAEAAGSGRTAGPLPSAVSATSAPGSQAAPRPVVQEADGGKARFVCCGFGGRKAGSKSSSKR